MTAPEWPRAASDLLTRLWGDGMTAALIAAEIGRQTGFKPSRNAVMGKAHRMGLPGRPSPIKTKPVRLPRKPSGISVTKSRDPRRLDTAPQTVRETDKRADLPARPAPASEPVLRPGSECRWPTSNDRPWTFCGATCEQGFSYCPEHRARAYTPGTANGGQRKIGPSQDSDVQTVKHRVAFKRVESKWSL